MKSFFIILILLVSLDSASAQTAKEKKIQELLELTGSGNLGMQVLHNMFSSYQKAMPNVPKEFWDGFFNQIDAASLIKMVIPIYEKHYSEQDIDDLITFYKTPLGKKVLESTPLIMQESMEAGKAWGREIAEKVTEELKKKGYN